MNNPYTKMTDGVHQMSTAISHAISFAQTKREFIGKQVVNGFLLFIILLVFGCLDFVNLSVHLEYLATLSYWSTIFSKVVAGVCAFNIGINIMWETELKKDAILADAIVMYEKLMSYKQVDFEYYVMQIFNPKEKTKAYISQINRKIYFLNKISKASSRLLFSTEIPQNAENYEKLVKELEEKKAKDRYCRKRQELENLKNPEFIKKNLDGLKVKYHEVDPSVFELEVDGSSKYHGLKTVGNVNSGKIKASSNVVLGMLGISMFITALSLDINQQQFEEQMVAFFHYLLKCLEDVGIVLWQFLRGMLKTRSIISGELTQVYVGRNKVLTDYLEWRLATSQPDSNVYKELHKDDDVETIELTEEQLTQITNPSASPQPQIPATTDNEKTTN